MTRRKIVLGITGLIMSSMAVAGVATAAPANAAEGQLACNMERKIGRWVTVNADRVNVRSGWGTSYPVIGQKNRGDHLCVTGGHEDKSDPDLHWWRFHYHGRSGWIIDTYVTYGWH